MIVDRDGNITILTQEKASVKALVNNIETDYHKYKNYHLIVNLTSTNIIEFLRISNNHRREKKSFVVVTSSANLDVIPDEIVVVPTMQEAHDIIEMEDIERDLEF